MRRIALFLLVMILGTAAFAAAPKPAPAAKPAAVPAPVTSAKAPGMIVGVEDGSPYMRFMLNKDQSVDVSLTYNNTDSNNNAISIWGRLDNKIGQVGVVNTSWNVDLAFTSGKRSGVDFSVIGIGGGLTAGCMILENVEVYGNVNLLTLANTTVAGSSSTSYRLISGSGNCYSGIRVYL